jgi:hypothetical protein
MAGILPPTFLPFHFSFFFLLTRLSEFFLFLRVLFELLRDFDVFVRGLVVLVLVVCFSLGCCSAGVLPYSMREVAGFPSFPLYLSYVWL